MTPSVSFKVNIPEDMTGNFYSGTVFVGLKDNVFEPSSSLRHLVEFDSISPRDNPIECHYHDGGPDHNIRHMRNKLANIAYFLHRNLDMLCSIQTPPYHSWKNPCERCMSLLNLGLQGVGIMRQETETCESYLKNANNLAAIQKLKEKHPEIVREVSDSLNPTKELMSSVFRKLSLKDEPLQTFNAASNEELTAFCNVLKRIDEEFDPSCLIDTSKPLKGVSEKILRFMEVQCRERHYLFSVKKCKSSDCVCGEVCLEADIVKDVHHLPDQTPSTTNPDKFTKFQDIYGKDVSNESDKYLPSKNVKSKEHGMPFSPTIQTAKNTKLVLLCEECLCWRCVYSQKKLSNDERAEAMSMIDILSYSCSSSLQDVHEFDCNDQDDQVKETILSKLHMSKKLTCNSPMEVPYYGVFVNEPLCYYCGKEAPFPENAKQYFPICKHCTEKGRKIQPRPKRAKNVAGK